MRTWIVAGASLGDAAAALAARGGVLGVGVRLGAELAALALVLLDRGGARYYLGGLDPRHERRGPCAAARPTSTASARPSARASCGA